ncbi:ABC-2 type transport system permease protein [Proteiniborus sp. DW1]|uniref:ABC transporter permease subunit n=1 Tax=Proteiniborus sp. DW1 TaxID=1889883 RepID=UPI00092DEF09|nr:ABC transporter permease subunit [Proteiniborus sp. DW1]SCG81678.1 ABC-2 type transport system permease protein [Proteiniborus sp. DW1]
MSWILFKANIKDIRTIWIIMTCIFCFYLAIVISMFDPAGADALNEVLETFPEALINALGMKEIGTNLLAFITSYIYGFLVLLMPMVVSIVVNHKIIGSHIDKGSLAYLLATPNSRIKIAITQAIFSLASITMLFIVSTIFSILVCESMFPGQLEIGKFILINIYALLMYYTIGGIGFLASCISSESKTSLGIGIGIPLVFLVFHMLGNVGDKLSWIGNLSLYSLYDLDKLIAGHSFAYIGMISFVILAAILYTCSIVIFNKRDFSL